RLTIVGIRTLEYPIPLALRVHPDPSAETFQQTVLQEIGSPETPLMESGVRDTAAFEKQQILRDPRVDVGIIGDDIPSWQQSSRHVELDALTTLFTACHRK